MTKKLLLTLIMLIMGFSMAFAQEERSNNLGYYETPGFVMFGISSAYTHGDTSSSNDYTPIIMGGLNVLQGERGNLTLTLTGMYNTPYRDYNIGGQDFSIDSKMYTGELGINYSTSSKFVNILLGGGYSMNFLESELNGFSSSKSYSQTVGGWFYHIGLQIFPKQSSDWAVFVLIRGMEGFDRPEFEVDGKTLTKSISNKTYTLGVSYNF